MNADDKRRLENIVRFGTIKTINPSKPIPTVIVNLDDIDTPEIRCLNTRSGTDSTWDMPSINEECVVISPCGDIGPSSFVLYGFYNENNPAPSDDLNKKLRVFSDGCVIAYDVAEHHLSAILPGGGTAELTALGGITINGDTTINGNVNIVGTTHSTDNISTDANIAAAQNITAIGGMSAKGNIQSQGEMNANGDVTAGSISLQNHKHSGVQSGSSSTGVPQ
ncbi:MAG: phage baseplate assembly protein V [Acinetobacter baumannii]|nr:phage baseplate assembly protein V [Acinetobacter baumannii]